MEIRYLAYCIVNMATCKAFDLWHYIRDILDDIGVSYD